MGEVQQFVPAQLQCKVIVCTKLLPEECVAGQGASEGHCKWMAETARAFLLCTSIMPSIEQAEWQ